jgi:hypothetical protein
VSDSTDAPLHPAVPTLPQFEEDDARSRKFNPMVKELSHLVETPDF